MNRVKGILLMCVLLTFMIMAGCWDRREIEDIGFVLGLGIDKLEKVKAEEEKEQGEGRQKIRPISIVNHFVIPHMKSGNNGGGNKKNYKNVISEGDNVFQILRELSTTVELPPNYEHLKVIIISEDVASSMDLRKLVNFFLRNQETRRTIKLFIAQGRARDVFESEPILVNDLAIKMLQITDNAKRNLRIAPELDLGEMSEKLTAETSFIVQRVITSQKKSRISGAAVIQGKSHKMVGWLSEAEMEGLNWINGKGKMGVVEGKDDNKDEIVIYEVDQIKRKIKPYVEGDKISFVVEVETEGALREDWAVSEDAFDHSYIERMEQTMEEEINRSVDKALAKIQKELKVDVAGFGKQLSFQYPEVWEKVKDNWESRFSAVPIEVRVNAQIREFGTKGRKN